VNFVLNASVTLAWAFDDERNSDALDALERLRAGEAVVASLWPLEVANGLLAAERRGRTTAADANRFVHLVRSLPIVVDPVARVRAFEATMALARKHGLTAYVAAYLELASRLGVPHATLDGDLRAAADAEGVADRLSADRLGTSVGAPQRRRAVAPDVRGEHIVRYRLVTGQAPDRTDGPLRSATGPARRRPAGTRR
jgi:predicted nucleic acid-binding protein